ncbi:hypothetical protein R69927_00798 [Paraburkholderia domus]|jgi:Uncharacterized protein conserved in bacteria|uniref:ABC-type transport auxiliary lipoprotein component domain-containing protein n=1 Tax=Paraburkholderia domus TaxID=2793075 RepID=A0A9N8MKJ4_9BURK|nr:PqiC family protein [Paraburkholderia domus]MBK5049247.1 membrane integrity-associated transporter subunit PqiC [Burkholderia sp. R-70006]MBK5060216.1 membrane integrity-associated transporter subunit PqiC [Burkholderia sp. R-70199]MBK5085152.1 membrane integrity-associated transporter subunit PqiC [Burkholderia sp. R-69927]MBK5118480.1 membrane integrity-associated transporter subunit PqiC [Burkholderia sp. R-69980]MBK5164318.1 membrane integrity-associated transporter subunit PqiC [Burkho
MTRSIRFLLAALAIGTLGGCSSPRAGFYTLSSDATLERSGPVVPISIVVGPVTVPEVVDRPQMVTRVSDNEVAVNEFARWGESLKSNIPRVIAGNLVQLLGTENVSVFPQGGEAGGYQISVAILRFDSVPGDSVTIDALWTVHPPKQAAPVTGHTVAHEPVTGSGYDAIAAAHSRALAAVSRDVAAATRQTLPR